MRKTLLAMAEDKFVYEDDSLVISESRLEFMCEANETIQGKFYIESELKKDTKGILYSTNSRMTCSKVRFSGKKVEISYTFDAKGLVDKETVKGDIYIESNLGEYNLPFVVTVLNEAVNSSLGVIRNLFHFANLAHADYEEAYKLFKSGRLRLIKMSPSERMHYEMLARANVNREHMEEFLLTINKKKPVVINIENTVVKEIYKGELFSKTISINKNGWGYLQVKVSADAEFIKLEKNVIYAEDFVGNIYDYSFLIEPQKLHAGRNYAQITFDSFNQKIVVDVEIDVEKDSEKEEKNTQALDIKKIKAELCQLYIQVRTHTIHNAVWIRESLGLVEKWLSYEPDNKLVMLFNAQLLILDKKNDDAGFILDKFKKEHFLKRQEPEVYAYLLYVQVLFRQQEDFTKQAIMEVKALLQMHPHSFKILWALLFLDDELHANALNKYQMLHEQFVYGCKSPFLYLEAYLLLRSDISLMSNWGVFEKQVLSFALHQALITENIAVEAAKASISFKDYDVLWCRLLKSFYKLFERKECLEAVCSQLLKGGFRNEEAFEWYALGVNAGLKLNLLYEYYIYTVPSSRKEILPKELMLYFSYNHNMDYRNKAYLYSNIMRYKNDIGNLYEKYEPYIGQFVQEQVAMRHVNEDLMYLYENNFESILDKKECCDVFEELLFTNVVTCKRKDIKRVIVCYEELTKREEFPLIDNTAYIRIYTDSAFIALEDLEGRLHFETVDFNIKPLLTRTKINRFAGKLKKEKTGILLNRYKKNGTILDEEGAKICNRLLKKEIINSEFQEELLDKLIVYFENSWEEEIVVNLLQKVDFAILDAKRRNSYMEKMILLGMYEEVYELLFEYGYENVNPKRLVRLCSRLISAGKDEDRLVELCAYVFRQGKYDDVMIRYLVSEYYGTTYQMIAIWRAANNFDIDSYKICERLLIQMLFTGFMPGKTFDIFEDYCAHSPKSEIIIAYISYLSYEYVVNEQVLEDRFFKYIFKLYNKKEKLNESCILAYLKYCSEKNAVNEQEKQFIIETIENRSTRLSFFKNAAAIAGIDNLLNEKIWIEYLANPKKKVVIYYRILGDECKETEFIREEIKPVFGPVFSKEVTLFYGESLQYYIVEDESKDTASIYCSGIITREAHDIEGNTGCYGWINDMYISRSLKDEKTLLSIMNKYKKYEIITQKLFELKE